MGISSGSAHFLVECRRRLGPFGKTLSLGRQAYKANRIGRIYAMLTKANIVDPASVSIEDLARQLEDGGAERFFELLGATQVDSMDISDYQGANIVHDLNKPLSPDLYNSYDTVIDGGTIEHVFNIPEAFRSVMKMVRPGGRFIALTIANNYYNHGLYQFSAELFYRSFAPENGFEMEMANFRSGSEMVGAADPGRTKRNGQMAPSAEPGMLLIAARKVEDVEPFQSCWPAQGQYAPQWNRGAA